MRDDFTKELINALTSHGGLFSLMTNRSYDPLVLDFNSVPTFKSTHIEPNYTELNESCSSCGATDYKRITEHKYRCTYCGSKKYI